MEKLNIDNFLTVIITNDGRIYKVDKENVKLHRYALEESYNYFKDCGIYIMPYPFFKGNNITCQMISASGHIAFMNIGDKEGILYLPDTISEEQNYILNCFNVEGYRIYAYDTKLKEKEVNYGTR